MITIQQLRYFVSVSQTLNFSAAARLHYVTQSTISQQIRLMEEDLEVCLVERTRRSVKLTPAGEVYYQYALQVLDLMQLAEKSARKAGRERALALDISMMPGLENMEIFNRFQELKENYPNLSFHVHRMDWGSSINSIRQNQVDLALITEIYPMEGDEMDKISLPPTQNYIVVSNKSRFAQFTTLSRSQLAGEPLYMIRLSSKEWSVIFEHYQEHGLEDIDVHYVDDIETLLLTLSLSNGYSILFRPALQHIPATKNLAFIPLEDRAIPVSLIWNRNNTNPALAVVLEYLRGSGYC